MRIPRRLDNPGGILEQMAHKERCGAPDSGTGTTSRRDFVKSFVTVYAAGAFWHDVAHGSGKNSVRFGIVTDLHYADRPVAGTRFYRDSLSKIREAVEVMNQERPDFLIELGDLKDQDVRPQEHRTLTYLRTIERELSKFGGPVYHVLGNHDMDSLSKEQFLQNVTNSGIRSGSSYYSFDSKGFHFVVLDANYSAGGQAYDHGNYDWTDANIPEDELEWLRSDLAASSDRTVVFVHQLLDGVGEHYIRNAPRVREVLERSGRVLAVFQGHQHRGQYAGINGIHYITMQAMVEGQGPEHNRYSLVRVAPDGNIEITGFRKEESRDLSALAAPSA